MTKEDFSSRIASTDSSSDIWTREAMQESEYVFPYHHITDLRNGHFRLCRIIDWGVWGIVYTSYVRFVALALQKMNCDSVLDVGCGDGRLLRELKEVGIRHLAGIDVSERAICFARGFVPTAQLVCGDITESKEQFIRRFEAVTLIDTLEHIPPKILPQFINAVARYLTPTGHVLVTVPSTNLELQEKHYQHFDLNSLKHVLSPTLEVIEYGFLNRTGLVNGLLRRILVNGLFVLNNDKWISFAYRLYERYCLHANANDGCRIYAVCRISQ